MKYKTILAIGGIFVFSFVFSLTHAQNLVTDVKGNVDVEANAKVKINNSQNFQASSDSESTLSEEKSTSTIKEKNDTDTSIENEVRASTTGNVQGKLMSDEHRSVVATFVSSLLSVAGREVGIGTEVRAIAKDQGDSATTTAEAIVKIDGKGFLRTFLFGSDYKNLGVIRSEMATTTNNINRLKALLDRTTSVSDRTELNIQIQALLSEQAKVEVYVKEHEDTFSLFGWFVKLFE